MPVAVLSPPLKRMRGLAAPIVRATYHLKRPILVTRLELPLLLNRRGLLGVGFEIGVREGDFSAYVLQHWRGRLLVSVDPWLEAPADEYQDVANVEQARQDALYAETQEKLSRFGERSEIWRTTSTEAADKVLPGSADFVYIDARHDYASVKEDLEHWYPKLRPGGILAGHDYLDGERSTGVYGVKSAVDEFFGASGIKVSQTLLDPPWRSWVVTVPH